MKTPPRVPRLLERLTLAGLTAVALVGLALFAAHDSSDPWIFGWSRRYALGAVAPVLAFLLLQGTLVAAPRGRLDHAFVVLWLGASLVVSLAAPILPPYELPVFAVLLALMALPLAAWRASAVPEWLLVHGALAGVTLLLFVPEAAGTLAEGRIPGDHRRPTWGDPATFRHLFPNEEPFISRGGRLRPNLDLDVHIGVPGQTPYRVRTNAAGFRNDREIAEQPGDGELRVLNLGDSFSIGYGVDQDRFLGPLLESWWTRAEPGRAVTVLNAEVSDPAYGLLHLQRYGVGYAPDIVLTGYVDNDAHQSLLPFERGIFSWGPDGGVRTHPLSSAEASRRNEAIRERFASLRYPARSLERSPPGPWSRWAGPLVRGLRELRVTEWLVGSVAPLPTGGRESGELPFINDYDEAGSDGHLRVFDFLTNFGMLHRDPAPLLEPIYEHLFRVYDAMHATAERNGAQLVLVYYPRRQQVQPQDWRRYAEYWNLDPDDFDLDMEAKRLRAFAVSRGIRFIDTTPALREAALEENVYMYRDTHLNARGQEVAARVIYEALAGAP